jgi:hypothetical protein
MVPAWPWTRKAASTWWPTLVGDEKNGEPTIGIFYAASADGSGFGRRERIPTSGVPHHPRVVAVGEGSLIAVWDESGDGARRVAVGRGRDEGNGRVVFKRELIGSSEAAVYPTVAVAADAAVVAWTSGTSSGSSIRVHRVAIAGAGSH